MSGKETDLFDLSDVPDVIQKLIDIVDSADETAKNMHDKDDAVSSAFMALASVADTTLVVLEQSARFAAAQRKILQIGNALPPEQRDAFLKGMQLGEELFNDPQPDESNESDEPAGPPDWISEVLKEGG